MREVVMIGLCALVFGCVNDQMGSRLASWQGSHFNEVAVAWGPPEECSADASQRICEWHIRPTAVSATPLPAGPRSCTTMLAFDARGYVTGWRWRGDRCQQTATVVAANLTRERPDALSLDPADDSTLGVAASEPTDR